MVGQSYVCRQLWYSQTAGGLNSDMCCLLTWLHLQGFLLVVVQ